MTTEAKEPSGIVDPVTAASVRTAILIVVPIAYVPADNYLIPACTLNIIFSYYVKCKRAAAINNGEGITRGDALCCLSANGKRNGFRL